MEVSEYFINEDKYVAEEMRKVGRRMVVKNKRGETVTIELPGYRQ